MRNLLVGASFFALAGAVPALAQEGADASTVDEVVVTGSRIVRQDFEAASPLVTVSEEAVERTGTVTVEAALHQMPQVAAGASSTTNLPSNQGRTTVDLRGLGATRTLVLMDGRRMAPSDNNGTVDVNAIPTALIANVEVITGGASAVYGSDAISGVVNFRMKRDFSGFQLDGQYGLSEQGDLQQKSVTGTWASTWTRGAATRSCR